MFKSVSAARERRGLLVDFCIYLSFALLVAHLAISGAVAAVPEFESRIPKDMHSAVVPARWGCKTVEAMERVLGVINGARQNAVTQNPEIDDESLAGISDFARTAGMQAEWTLNQGCSPLYTRTKGGDRLPFGMATLLEFAKKAVVYKAKDKEIWMTGLAGLPFPVYVLIDVPTEEEIKIWREEAEKSRLEQERADNKASI